MTDSPELAASPRVVDDVNDGVEPDDPHIVSPPAPPRRRRRGVRMQQSLAARNVVAPQLERIQQAVAATAVHRVRVADLPASVWEGSALAAALTKFAVPDGCVAGALASWTRGWEQSVAAQATQVLASARAASLLGGLNTVQTLAGSVAGATAVNLAAEMAKTVVVDNSVSKLMSECSSMARTSVVAQTATMLQPIGFAALQPLLPPLLPQFKPISVGLLESLPEMSVFFSQQLDDFLRTWANESAGWASGLRETVRAFRERLFLEVLAAQDAAMRDDLEKVAVFFDRWAELPRSNRAARIRAGAYVLLDLKLTEFGPDHAFDLVELIEERANTHYQRGSRPLDETMLNGRRVVALGELAVVARVENAEDLLPKAPSAESRVIASLNIADDPRLAIVLDSLKPEEAQIVWARGFTNSWWAAAISCGCPPEDARRISERVRDKFVSRMRRLQLRGRGLMRQVQG